MTDDDERRVRPATLPPPPPAATTARLVREGLAGPLALIDVLRPPTLARPKPKLLPARVVLPALVRGLGGAVDAEEAPLPDARVGRLTCDRVGLFPLDGGRPPPREPVGLLRLICRVAFPSCTWLTCERGNQGHGAGGGGSARQA